METVHQTVIGPKMQKSAFKDNMRKSGPLLIFLLPGTLFLLIFSYLPMPGILIAFKNYKVEGRNIFENFFKSDWVGLSNFKFLFQTPDALVFTRNTVLYNIGWLVLGLVLSVLVAICINELWSSRAAKLYQTLFMLPYFLSWIVVSYFVYALLNTDYGLVNKIGLSLGVIKDPIQWYMEPKFWPIILTIANQWKYLGYGSVIYIAAISGFDTELYEAAAMDGATKLQQIKNITLPLLKPMMIILTILSLGRIFNADFGLFFSLPMNSGMLKPTTMVVDTYVFSALTQGFNIGLSSAAGFYQSVVGFILIFSANFVVRKIDKDSSLF